MPLQDQQPKSNYDMRIFLVMGAVVVLGACAAGQTQVPNAAPSTFASAPPIPEQGDPVPTAGQPAGPSASLADLTGKLVYSGRGHKIGTVVSVRRGVQGEQYAVVNVGKFLGLEGKNLLFPVSSLALKNSHGYATSLTSSQIRALHETQSAAP